MKRLRYRWNRLPLGERLFWAVATAGGIVHLILAGAILARLNNLIP